MGRTTLREIRQSFGRYIAILAIVALGVGFFAGLKMVKPAMIEMAEDYWEDTQLFDYRLLSTLGFQEEDVDFFAAQEDVRAAEGAVSADILCVDDEQNEKVMMVHSLMENINRVRLTAGRMPQETYECVVDSGLYTQDKLGEKILLSEDNQEEDRELFAYEEYTIVGIAQSSYYVNFERGNTSLGNGRISGFMYILPEGFACDYFTEIFVRFDQKLPLYSQKYKDYMEEKEELWDQLCAQRAKERYDSILEDAQTELDDARAELNDKETEAQEELAKAETELNDAQQEIEDGKAKLADGWQELEDKEAQLKEQEELISRQETELEAQKQALQAAAIDPASQLGAMQGQLGQTGAIDPALQLAAMQEQISQAQAQLSEARQQIEAAKRQLSEARKELEEKENELLEAEEELTDGWQEYNDSYEEFQEKIEDARQEIEDAQAKVDDIEEPDHYVLGRNTNVGYVCFDNDSQIIDSIANVVPLFFFMVAALVCITTMNRMVEEQRTQIGVLKALGYGEAAIMSKYLFYSGSAALLGGALGFVGGTWLFPKVIWAAYCIMYRMAPVEYLFDGGLALISFAVAILCSVGATWFSCRNELLEVAANLMRPKAPKAGKRVLLEHVPFIWKRLKFLHKVSVRNILRYKKRFFMMVAGISGCTALLVTGFGLKDSISDVALKQFNEIQIYDMSVALRDPADNGVIKKEVADLLARGADSYAFFHEGSVDLVMESEVKSVNLVIPQEGRTEGFLDFHTIKGEEVVFPNDGEAVLSNKLAQQYGISVGDEILVRDEDMHQISVRVSGVFQNFVYNYICIAQSTYQTMTGEEPEYKTIYVNLKEDQEPHQVSAAFMGLEEVSGVTVNADTQQRFLNMMSSLDYVVLLIILCAAFLAFIVIYNLTNINITERLREIATLKVLGFFGSEAASYVFRENILLTVIGAAVGLVLGRILHAFVMSQINIDMIAFDVHVKPMSYLYSVLLTAAFTCFVNLFMSVKLERINMAESLKSVD